MNERFGPRYIELSKAGGHTAETDGISQRGRRPGWLLIRIVYYLAMYYIMSPSKTRVGYLASYLLCQGERTIALCYQLSHGKLQDG